MVVVDGKFGPDTIEALQKFLNDNWSKARFRNQNRQKLAVDGQFGPDTIKALQTFLNSHWAEARFRDQKLTVDGKHGPHTIKALKTFLNSHWAEARFRDHKLAVDDHLRPSCIMALQTFLSAQTSAILLDKVVCRAVMTESNTVIVRRPRAQRAVVPMPTAQRRSWMQTLSVGSPLSAVRAACCSS
jgi:hypothetical protein